MNRIFKFATLFVLLAAFGFAQTTMTSTTLTPNIAATATVFAVGSATGISGLGPLGQYQTMLYIDHELMGVRSISGTNVTVDRGKWAAPPGESSVTTHHAGTVVWLGPPGAFNQTDPAINTQCVRTQLQYVPYISTASGRKYDCLGLTTAGAWVRTDANGQGVLGATVASPAGVITLGGTVVTVSGTNAITGITVPAGAGVGFQLTILPSGNFTFTTATNIALAGTAVTGRALVFTWNGTAWYPSYV